MIIRWPVEGVEYRTEYDEEESGEVARDLQVLYCSRKWRRHATAFSVPLAL